jgi:hypothetical protein
MTMSASAETVSISFNPRVTRFVTDSDVEQSNWINATRTVIRRLYGAQSSDAASVSLTGCAVLAEALLSALRIAP